MGSILRAITILIGILILILIVFSLAKRRMTQFFCLVWFVIALLMILAGIVLKPSLLNSFLSRRGFILLLLVGLIIFWTFWFLTMEVSLLSRRNRELAIQTSLLNEEVATLSHQVEQLQQEKGIDQ